MRRLSTTFGVGLLALSLIAGGLGNQSAFASSHREAPSTAVDPQADATDVYAFVDPVDPTRVTFVANFIPFQLPQGGPNFYRFGDSMEYALRIDNNGDAVTDIQIVFRFTTTVGNVNTFLYNTGQVTSLNDPDLNIKQFYSITVIRGSGTTATSATITPATPAAGSPAGFPYQVAPSNVGVRSMPNYEADLGAPAVFTASSAAGMSDIRVFTGQRDDPFFVDVGSAFDLFALRPFNSAHLLPRTAGTGIDGLAGFNVNTVAIQAPIRELTSDRQPLPATNPQNDPRAVISVYSATSRPQNITYAQDRSGGVTFSGPQTQLSRLGNPFINELLVPLGMKDRFNASLPGADAQFLGFVLAPEPGRLFGHAGSPPAFDLYPSFNAPAPPRNDVATVFLTGIPGLNLQTDQVGNGVAAFTGQPGDTVPQERLRLNMGIPPTAGTASAAGTANRLGFLGGDNAGFPNGRRLGDDAPDIELRVLAGATTFTPAFNVAPNNLLGDGVNENDRPFLTRFPYVATPYAGYDSPTTPPQGIGTTDTQAPSNPRAEPTPRP